MMKLSFQALVLYAIILAQGIENQYPCFQPYLYVNIDWISIDMGILYTALTYEIKNPDNVIFSSNLSFLLMTALDIELILTTSYYILNVHSSEAFNNSLYTFSIFRFVPQSLNFRMPLECSVCCLLHPHTIPMVLMREK